jgi:hypothetical protein
VVEEQRLRKDGKKVWAVETMLEAGVLPTRLLREYVGAFRARDLRNEIKAAFAYAIAFLVDKGANVRGLDRELREVKSWFMAHGRDCSDRDVAFALVHRL